MILLNLISLAAMIHLAAVTRGLILIASVLLIGGCGYYHHSEPDRGGRPVQSLQQTTVCCDSLGELTYRELIPNEEIPILLDDNDPVYEFETGKSYVEAFDLPRGGGITLLQIDSLVGIQGLREFPTAVFPVVTLLDSNFEKIVTLDQLPFDFFNSAFDQRRIRMVVTIDDQFPDASYALIHTSERMLLHSLSTRNPHTIIKNDGFDTMIYDNPESSRKQIKFSHSGALNVLIYPI